MGARGKNARPIRHDSGASHIEGLSWAALGELKSGWSGWPDPFADDRAFWKAWKAHRKQLLAEHEIARRPYAYWLEVLPEDEPFPVWHCDQAIMLLMLDLCKNKEESEVCLRIVTTTLKKEDYQTRYVRAKAVRKFD